MNVPMDRCKGIFPPASKMNYAGCETRVLRNWKFHNVHNQLLPAIALITGIALIVYPGLYFPIFPAGSFSVMEFWLLPSMHSRKYGEYYTILFFVHFVSTFRLSVGACHRSDQ